MKTTLAVGALAVTAALAGGAVALADTGAGQNTAPMHVRCQLPLNKAAADVQSMNAARAAGRPLTPAQINAFCA